MHGTGDDTCVRARQVTRELSDLARVVLDVGSVRENVTNGSAIATLSLDDPNFDQIDTKFKLVKTEPDFRE